MIYWMYWSRLKVEMLGRGCDDDVEVRLKPSSTIRVKMRIQEIQW